MITHQISNLISRLNNESFLQINKTADLLAIAGILQYEGIITFYYSPFSNTIYILKNINKKFKVISKPGRRQFVTYKELPYKSLNLYILKTPMGLMTNIEAIKNKIGGELLISVD